MRIGTVLLLTTGFLLLAVHSSSGATKEDVEKIFKAIKWYGHASFAIEADRVICIDPWNVSPLYVILPLPFIRPSWVRHSIAQRPVLLPKWCKKDCSAGNRARVFISGRKARL